MCVPQVENTVCLPTIIYWHPGSSSLGLPPSVCALFVNTDYACHGLRTKRVCQLQAIGIEGHLCILIFLSLTVSLTATMIHSKSILSPFSNSVYPISTLLISFKCSICGGREVIFIFCFQFRTWVAIATSQIILIQNFLSYRK